MSDPGRSGEPRPDPHGGGPALGYVRPDRAALILLHGRGASAGDILGLGIDLAVPDLGLIAPEAAGNSWYPYSFLAPIEANQPHLDSALARVESIVGSLLAGGLPPGRIARLGFSQGACLALEFLARHPRAYGAVMGLTGGLIGPPGTPREYGGRLDGVPVFLGTNDPDPHIPFGRVLETEAVLGRMGASVELRRYPGMPHSVNEDESEVCRRLLLGMLEDGDPTARIADRQEAP